MRRRLEYVLRGAVLATLALMLWFAPQSSRDAQSAMVDSHGVGASALNQWSRAPVAPQRINLQLTSIPSRIERAWLSALAAAGSVVTWRGGLTPVMVAIEPVAAPHGGATARAAAPDASAIVIGDEIGALDSARIRQSGATFVLGAASDSVTVRANGSVASAALRDSVSLRKVLVIGAAGWEPKFTAAALEEEGWKVDLLARVAPGVEVTSGAPATIDTSRYSAVIALDASAAPYASRLTEFVRAGGGLIIAPPAAAAAAMVTLRAAGPDAIVLEKRGAATSVAAKRLGAGRVIQIAYEDTWRSRMNGGDSAVANHRRLWTNLVSNVAYAPRVARATANPADDGTSVDDAAPLADLTASIGSPTSAKVSALTGRSRSSWTVLLFLVLTLALLGEVASRRFRGVS